MPGRSIGDCGEEFRHLHVRPGLYVVKPGFPSLHSGEKRFLGANECVYRGPYVIVGFVTQYEIFSSLLRHLHSKAWIHLSVSARRVQQTTSDFWFGS